MLFLARLAVSVALVAPVAAFRTGRGVPRARVFGRGRGVSVAAGTGTGAAASDDAVPFLPPLRNRYFALRHGQSTANVEGVISSLPAVGTTAHGLTPLGVEQARAAAPQLLAAVGGATELSRLVVYSSDFTRARETAEQAQAALRDLTGAAEPAGPVGELTALRERWFGTLDGQNVATYNDVWPLDLEDAHHTTFGVESVHAVAVRLRQLFQDLEAAHPEPGTPIVLTSHADTLQIMQCLVAQADVRLFSQYRFANGEVRALGESPGTLPSPKPLSRDVSRM